MPRTSKTWPGITQNVSEARDFVCRTLTSWGASDFEWAAITVVSELTTNAVLHAGTAFSLAMNLTDDRLHLEVSDGCTLGPVLRSYGFDGTTGRGVRLVVQLSETWGINVGETTKSVWCVLAPGSASGLEMRLEWPEADR